MRQTVLVALALFGCDAPEQRLDAGDGFVTSHAVVNRGLMPTDFFPLGVLDAHTAEWSGEYLAAMGEPSLWAAAVKGESAYRLLILPSFARPVSVRVTRVGSGARFVATRLTGYGGYGPGKVDQHRERGLSIAEWQRIESVANAAGFDPLESSKGPGVDGADFILERAFNGNHRLVWRWSPEDAAFMSVCDALLDLGARDLVIETEPKLDRPSSNRKSDGG